MNTNDKTWDSTMSNYLRQVERVLTAARYPSRKSIIEEVRLHLEQRYAELPPEKRNWEGFQQVITEMGPPSDYAELLGVGRLKRRIITWRRIAVGLPIILVLLAYGMYKGIIPMGVYSGPRTYVIPELVGAPFERPFGSDGNLVGEWVTVDFVNSPSQFVPGKRQWPTNQFWLNQMSFTDGGDMRATVNGIKSGGKAVWASRCKWTKGWIMDRENRIQAQYAIKETDGALYLFYPWLSGDVSIRYLPPSYYVLKKAGSDRSVPSAGSPTSAKSQSLRVRFVPGSAPMKGAAAYARFDRNGS